MNDKQVFIYPCTMIESKGYAQNKNNFEREN